MALSPSSSPSPSLSPAPSPMLRGQYARRMDTSMKPRTMHYHAATLSALEGYPSPPAQEPQPVSQFDFDSTDDEEAEDAAEQQQENTDTRPVATLRLGRLRQENLHKLHQRVRSPALSTRASSAKAGSRDGSLYDLSRPVSRALSRFSSRKLRPTASMFTFGRQNEALMAAEDFGTGPIYAVESDTSLPKTVQCQYLHQYANGMAHGSPSSVPEAQAMTTLLQRSATEPKKTRRRRLQKKSSSGLAARDQAPSLEALDEFMLPSPQDPVRDDLSSTSPASVVVAANRLSMPVTGREHAGVRGGPGKFTAISEDAERDTLMDNGFASIDPSTSSGRSGAGPRGAEMESRAEEAIAARKRFGSVDHSGWDAALAALSMSPSSTPGEECGNVELSHIDVDAAPAQGGAWSPNYNQEEEPRQRPTPPFTKRRRGRRNTALTLSLGGDSDSDSDLDQEASQHWPKTALQHTRYGYGLTEPVDLVSKSRRHNFLDDDSLRERYRQDDDQAFSSRPQRAADMTSTDAAATEALMHRQSATVGVGSEPLLPLFASPSALAQDNVSQVPNDKGNDNDNGNPLPGLSQSYPALEAQLTPPPPPAAEVTSIVPNSHLSSLTSPYQPQSGDGPDIQAWRDSLVPAAAAAAAVAPTTTTATPDASSSRFSRAMARTSTMSQQQQLRIGVRSAPFSSSSSNNSDTESRREDRSRGGALQRLKRITMRILGRDMSGTNTAVRSSSSNNNNNNNNNKNNETNNNNVSQVHENSSTSPRWHSDRNSGYQNDSGYGGSVTTTTTTTDARDYRNLSTATTATQIKFRDCAPSRGDRPPQLRSRRPSRYPDVTSSSFSSAGGRGQKGMGEVGGGDVSGVRRLQVRLSRIFH